MSTFKSPFEKLSYEAQESMAISLNPGGAVYSLLDELKTVVGTFVGGGMVADKKISKEALLAIEGLGLASKRLAGAIAVISMSSSSDIEKFFGVFTQLRKTLIEDLPDDVAEEMLRKSAILGVMADNVTRFSVSLARFAAMTPILLFASVAFVTIATIVGRGISQLKGSIFDRLVGFSMKDELARIADGILALGKNLAIFALLSPIAKFGAMAFHNIVASVHATMMLLGEGTSPAGWWGRKVMGRRGVLERGIKALNKMTRAILFFGTVLAINTPLFLIGILGAYALNLIIKILGGTPRQGFRALGDKRTSKMIAKGSMTLIFMSMALVLFMPGAIALSLMGVFGILMVLGAFLLSASLNILRPALMMFGKGFMQIAKGALAIGLMGLALIPLAFGIGILGKAFSDVSNPWEFLGWTAATILALGLEFAAAGLGAIFILPGALAIAAIGGALILLGKGLKEMQNINFTEEDSKKLATTLAGVKAAFMGTEKKEEGGIFAAIGGALKGAIDSAKIIASAAAYAAAGESLISLSKGLQKYKELGWSDTDSSELTRMLTGVSSAFAVIGGQDQVDSGGFFGSMFGIKRNAAEEGIRSVQGAGDALTGIAKGLKGFQKLVTSGIKFGKPDNQGNYEEGTLGYAVTNTMGFINTAFAAVAEQGTVQGGGFFDTLFSIKRNKVEEGIRSVMDSGEALSGIAKGLKGFQKLINSGIKFGTPDSEGKFEEGTFGYSVTRTLSFVQSAFAAIADEGNVQAGGFFGSVFNIKKNKVAEGIESVQGAGQELEGIANGLLGFQKLIESKVKFGTPDKDGKFEEGTLGYGVVQTLSFVKSAFAALADSGKVEKSGFWGGLLGIQQNKVEAGIESVQGAGEVLNGIADALNKFQGLADPKGTSEKITATMSIVGDAFMKSIKIGDPDDAIDLIKATAKGYKTISKASNEMNVEAIATTARMFEALGYLSQAGGKNAIESLGDTLVEAVQELASMIANFGGTVESAASSNESLIDKVGGFASSLNPFSDKGLDVKDAQGNLIGNTKSIKSGGGGSSRGSSSSTGGGGDSVDVGALVAEIKRLQNILMSGDAVVQVENNSF